MRFGISKEDAHDLYLSYDERTVLDHIELTEARVNNKKLLAVDSPGAYFRTALKGGYAKGSHVAKPAKSAKPKDEPVPEQAAVKPAVRERYSAARNEEAMNLYGELPAGEQQSLFAQFAKQADRALNTYIKKQGMNSALVRAAFADWFSMQTWGPISDAQIIEYIDSGRVL
jgi:hypothetical protein